MYSGDLILHMKLGDFRQVKEGIVKTLFIGTGQTPKIQGRTFPIVQLSKLFIKQMLLCKLVYNAMYCVLEVKGTSIHVLFQLLSLWSPS